jgi:hypothetical protein
VLLFAEPLLIQARKGRRLKLGYTHPCALESWHNPIEPCEAWGKTQKAEDWRAKLPRTEAVEQRHSTPKTASFPRVGAYNQGITVQLVICRFVENVCPVSSIATKLYKNPQIHKCFQ